MVKPLKRHSEVVHYGCTACRGSAHPLCAGTAAVATHSLLAVPCLLMPRACPIQLEVCSFSPVSPLIFLLSTLLPQFHPMQWPNEMKAGPRAATAESPS
jgi:hypothetical protein